MQNISRKMCKWHPKTNQGNKIVVNEKEAIYVGGCKNSSNFKIPKRTDYNIKIITTVMYQVEIRMLSRATEKQVPRGYIRCDYFIVTHYIIYYVV